MIEALASLLLGTVITIVPLTLLYRKRIIKNNGVHVEGIVFDLQESFSVSFRFHFPIIRFLTTNNDWITKKYQLGLPFFAYKRGQKVTVVYDINKPENFYIANKKDFGDFALYLIILIGSILWLKGIYGVFQSI